MLDLVGDDLAVVANTGDDVECYGAYVSPDPDLCAFWLADRIDERGWGLRDDTFNVMDGLRELGVDVWFNLGDRDLAVGLRRAELLAGGARLTEALLELTRSLGLGARVLPMSDDPVRTWVLARGNWTPFQEFMILGRGEGPVDGVELRGVQAASPSPEVLAAIAGADAIVIGPSNPVISIGPILAVPGMREALRTARAPVVAVSPLVDGQVLKGPTADFLAWTGLPATAAGIAELLGDVLDGMVCDEQRADGLPVLRTDTLMADADGRRRVAGSVLGFAEALAG
jgi:LPPG:FO 2-phospho-L-lactate transferase